MGTQVQGVPRGAALDPRSTETRTPDPNSESKGTEFGNWFERQREVRGISVHFVAARTRLPLQRICAIESGEEVLAHDGQGRALARILAEAIGADPEAAAGILLGPRQRTRQDGGLSVPWLAWAERAAVAAVIGLVAWLLGAWLLASPTEDVAEPVYRDDYVDRLLTDPEQ